MKRKTVIRLGALGAFTTAVNAAIIPRHIKKPHLDYIMGKLSRAGVKS